MENRHYPVAYRTYTTGDRLEVRAFLEQPDGKAVFLDRVRISIWPNFNKEKGLSIDLDSSEIRAFAYACKEILKRKESEYRKHSDPKRAGGGGSEKMMNLGVGDSGFFLNINEASPNGKKPRFVFDKYSLAAFVDDLMLIAEETQGLQYKYQREMQRRQKV